MHDLTRAGSAIAGHPAAKVPGAAAPTVYACPSN
nr:MAG TPA: hypothetical protein [Caudoviricetes sp.]